jgi:8-oxo-dGTP diphosphatase
MAQPRIAAGALFLDEQDRILLVRPAYKPMWDIPGGYVQPGESPLAACVREVREELGVSPSIGRHLVIDWAPAEHEGDKMLFVFDGGTLDAMQRARLRPDDEEITDYKFSDVDDLDQYVPARLARRLRTALAARGSGQPVYAEHGDEVTDARLAP